MLKPLLWGHLLPKPHTAPITGPTVLASRKISKVCIPTASTLVSLLPATHPHPWATQDQTADLTMAGSLVQNPQIFEKMGLWLLSASLPPTLTEGSPCPATVF